MRRRLHRLAFSLALVLLFLCQASASPKPLGPTTETFYRRQAAGSSFTEPVVMQTVQTINTSAGPVTQECRITFTPVTGPRGEPLVQVVRECVVVEVTSTSSATTSSTSTSTTTTTTTSSTQSTTTTTSASSSTSPAIVFTSVSISPTPASSSSPPPSTSTSSTTSPSPPPTTLPTAASTTSNGSSGVTAADSASASASTSAQAAFQIPGKKISVLPIGLGIFAGISVIALIVVGLVTYERTKYRKIFRQRKLAEQGERMGYSGLP